MGFLMPRHALIALALLLTACGSGSYLNAPLTPSTTDQQKREHAIAIPSPPLRVLWEASIDGYTGKAEILRVGEHALLSGIGGIIDILELRSGRQTGRINIQGFLHGSPAIVGGRLYAASLAAEATMQCHSLDNASLLWSAKVEPTDGSVCAAGERVLIVSNAGKVMCFGLGDSIPLWTRRLQGTFRAGPVVADSIVVLAGENGDVTGLSLLDGSVRWRQGSAAAFLVPPATDGGIVCAVNRKGTLIVVDAHSGALLFKQELREPVHAAPVLHGGSILVAMSGGDVLWLSREDGSEQRRVRSDRLPGASPQFVDGDVLLLARDGTLLLIVKNADAAVELAALGRRSAVPPLRTEFGILLVDEEGNAAMYGESLKGGAADATQ
jgi:outer membrane protein assembly factor BamB